MKRHKTVDDFMAAAGEWQEELARLRTILASTPLQETIKWGAPCYTHKGKNVVGIGAFRAYVGLWFFQGALLSDPDGVLINAQEGKTKAMRQWRFGSARDIRVRAIKAYVREAIALVDSGREIRPDRNQPVVVPPELQSALTQNSTTAAAFKALTKGRQREYAEFVASAKREETRAKRVAKSLPLIAAGLGLNDKYRNR